MKSKNLLIIVLIIIFSISSYSFLDDSRIDSLKSNYLTGQPIDGNVEINFTEEEFIPLSSSVNMTIYNSSNSQVISNNLLTFENFMSLSDNVINLNEISADSSVDNTIYSPMYTYNLQKSSSNKISDFSSATLSEDGTYDIIIPLGSTIFTAKFNLSNVPVGGENTSDITIYLVDGNDYVIEWSYPGEFNSSEITNLNISRLQITLVS